MELSITPTSSASQFPRYTTHILIIYWHWCFRPQGNNICRWDNKTLQGIIQLLYNRTAPRKLGKPKMSCLALTVGRRGTRDYEELTSLKSEQYYCPYKKGERQDCFHDHVEHVLVSSFKLDSPLHNLNPKTGKKPKRDLHHANTKLRSYVVIFKQSYVPSTLISYPIIMPLFRLS